MSDEEMAMGIASGREKDMASDEMAMAIGSIYSLLVVNFKLKFFVDWRPWDSLHC